MKIFNDNNFSEEGILDLLNSKLQNKIEHEDLETILGLIRKIANIQQIDFNELEYCGTGQTYTVLAIGDFVIKIGPEVSMLKNPYQMLPLKMDTLENSKQKIYLTQRCKKDNLSEENVQQMYNIIRDNGGIWIDPKKDNLGYKSEKLDVDGIDNNIDFFTIDKKIKENNGPFFVTDFEDVIFLTPEMIREHMDESKRWMTLPYGNLEGGTLGNRIFLYELNSIDDINAIYEKNFIMRSQTLLKYEEKYQLQKGNKQLAKKYNKRRKEIIKQIDQYYKNEGNLKNNRKEWSVKDIGTIVMQHTGHSRLKEMISVMKNRFYKNREINQSKKIQDNAQYLDKQSFDPFRTEDAR